MKFLSENGIAVALHNSFVWKGIFLSVCNSFDVMDTRTRTMQTNDTDTDAHDCFLWLKTPNYGSEQCRNYVP